VQDKPIGASQALDRERYMSRTLVLNATYEPLGVITDRRALILVLNHRAVMVEDSGEILRFAGGQVSLPAVVRLTKFVRIPYRHSVPLSRRAIFARDGGRCVYCAAPATSIDHVIPRSRGGGHNWENVVSACHKCNHVKADKHLKELGWRLRTLPREPHLASRTSGGGMENLGNRSHRSQMVAVLAAIWRGSSNCISNLHLRHDYF